MSTAGQFISNLAGKTAISLAILALACPVVADEGPYLGLQGGLSKIDSTDIKNGPAGGVVAGYTFANGLRPEVEVSYRRNAFEGDGDVRAGQAVASLYYNFSRNGYYFYLGGGGGYAQLSAAIGGIGKDKDGTPVYTAGTGIGLAATRQLMVGIDYRYVGTFDDSTFSYTVNDVPLSVDYKYRGSFVSLALRYSFGSARADSFPVSRPAESVRVVPVSP
ncbi:MAG: outer membrane beta-barrel protein [Nevskia sp.]|nr:outer membrane beta-barrel protein [Nevskia sp.]